MDLSTTQEVLLIILSSALAIFLILAIAVVVTVLVILKKVKLFIEKAEHIVESAETAANIFKKTATPVGIFHVIQNIVSTVSNKRNKD
jgi:hypothetical protein